MEMSKQSLNDIYVINYIKEMISAIRCVHKSERGQVFVIKHKNNVMEEVQTGYSCHISNVSSEF